MLKPESGVSNNPLSILNSVHSTGRNQWVRREKVPIVEIKSESVFVVSSVSKLVNLLVSRGPEGGRRKAKGFTLAWRGLAWGDPVYLRQGPKQTLLMDLLSQEWVTDEQSDPRTAFTRSCPFQGLTLAFAGRMRFYSWAGLSLESLVFWISSFSPSYSWSSPLTSCSLWRS